MLIVEIIGGLGNQMFCYAFGRALQERLGKPVYFDLEPLKRDALRSYALDTFDLKLPVAPPETIASLLHPEPSLTCKVLWKLGLHKAAKKVQGQSAVYREEEPTIYDPKVYQVLPETYFLGYWQNEQYFSDCADTIREAFRFSAPLADASVGMADRIASCESVAVHVRRGDYLTPKNQLVHGCCSMNYYERALAEIDKHTQNAHYFLFSDDPAWVKENLKVPGPSCVVDIHPPEAPKEDMRLMAMCRHHIIANSSFSWWGAWLGEGPGQIVVAPKRWFAEPGRIADIVPKRWKRI